jgi:hypothetical protein
VSWHRLSWLLIAGATSCGGIGGSVEQCVGGYSGNYEGSTQGLASAVLGFDAKLQVTFIMEGERLVNVSVAESGEMTGAQNGITVSGTLDVEECKVSGSWNRASGESGMFTLDKV